MRSLPFREGESLSISDGVDNIDDAWYRIFTDAEDGEDALVEATVTVGVGEGIPCGEDVGGVR